MHQTQRQEARLDHGSSHGNTLFRRFFNESQQPALGCCVPFVTSLSNAMRENNILTAALANLSLIIIDPHQPDDPIVFVNEAFTLLTGYLPTQAIGRNIRFLQGQGSDPLVAQQIDQRVHEGQAFTGVLLHYRADGQPFWSELRINPVYDDAGQLIQFVMVQQDVTERIQAQETLYRHDANLHTLNEQLRETMDALSQAYSHVSALNQDLRQSRDLLRTLFDGLSHGLLLLDRAGTVLAANQPIAHIFRKTLHTLVGSQWRELDPVLVSLIGATFEETAAHKYRGRFVGPEQLSIMLDIETLPINAPDGQVAQVIMHLTDVTEQLQREARAVENERFAANGRLAATIAHEINTPLQSIQSFLYLISTATDDERSDYLELAQQETERIAKIVWQLLELYRPSAMQLAPLNLNTLLDRVLRLVDHLLARNHIIIERQLCSSITCILGRSDQIIQLLFNLLMNAIQSMPSGGQITVRTRLEEQVIVEISDTGVGIPPEQQEQIFQPFFTTQKDGIGLGLTICSQIVQEHSGNIMVESIPGQGSIFRVCFPSME